MLAKQSQFPASRANRCRHFPLVRGLNLPEVPRLESPLEAVDLSRRLRATVQSRLQHTSE
jgi:hypothetical protein